jgi:hypothetical protein
MTAAKENHTWAKKTRCLMFINAAFGNIQAKLRQQSGSRVNALSVLYLPLGEPL